MRCKVRDEIGDDAFEIGARAIVNATGPWAQGLGLSKVQLRPTKGIHLVFAAARLPTNGAAVITEGKRILFVLPWGERTIVGTTDTDFSGPPENVKVEPADVDYLLKTANEFFPGTKLSAPDVLSSYAGVRPLIADAKGRPSDISRSHLIRQSAPGWWDVAGGKLTTYRLMAEQTVDAVAAFLGGKFAECSTAQKPLLEADEKRIGILPPEPSSELVEHFFQNEWAQTVEDVMTRRTSWRLYRKDAREIEEFTASVFSSWSCARTRSNGDDSRPKSG
jgi:glycerol-3-phosphate dehydrogenase